MASLGSLAKMAIFMITLTAVAGTAAFIFKNKIEIVSRDIREKQSLLAVLEKRDENFLALKADEETLGKNLPILRKALPREDDIDVVVSSLESLAVQTGNTVNLEFEPIGNSQYSGAIRGVKFSADLAGNIGTFSEYLKGVKKLPYFIEINGAAVSGSSGISVSGSRLVLNGRVYIRK